MELHTDLIGRDPAGLAQLSILASLLEERTCCFDVPSRSETDINKLSVLINGVAQVTLFPAGPQKRLIRCREGQRRDTCLKDRSAVSEPNLRTQRSISNPR